MYSLFGFIPIIFHLASLSLSIYTIIFYSVLFLRSNLQRTFSSLTGLSMHCYICNNDNNLVPMPSSSTASQINSTKHHSINKMPINNIFQNMSSTKKQKISNGNYSTQVNLNYKQSSNICLTTLSNKTHDNINKFDNLNSKYTLNNVT